MIPTLFAVCIIVFLIVNLAPGNPGEVHAQGDGAKNASSGSKHESYRIFKEQFHLNQPIFFNLRFNTTLDDIRDYIHAIANSKKNQDMKYIMHAQEVMDDLGEFAVPHLMTLLNTNPSAALQHIIIRYLSLSARQPLIKPYAKLSNLSKEEKSENKRRIARNTYVASLIFEKNTDASTRQDIVDKWHIWFASHQDEYRYSTQDKIRIFFLETRFAKYISNLLNLDFGISHVSKRPVFQSILERMKYSIIISCLAIALSYLIAVPIGIYSSTHQYSRNDRILTVILFVLYSLPTFFVGTLMLTIFSKSGIFPLFPAGGFFSQNIEFMSTLDQIKDIAWHLVLPILCLTYGALAMLSRYARTGLLEVIRSDYIRTARAKGLPESIVIIRHAVRNGMIPILTLLASILPVLIGGSVIVEFIFNIPGIGQFVLDAIYNRDYNIIMAVQLITAVMTLIGILLSDISYMLVDPRIKLK